MIYHIKNYCVTILGDEVAITDMNLPLYEDKALWAYPPQHIKNIEKITRSRGFKVGYANVYDMHVIYLYDSLDDNFGYAINLTVDYFSEWGYAPF